jgi:cytochrome oxidase Cu insertion factor (SCO1/SenC/PrrC family)
MKVPIRMAILLCMMVWMISMLHPSNKTNAQSRPAPPGIAVKVGDPAPDFTLRSSELKDVKLSDFKGKKNVVLAFYVLAFTGG